MDLIGQYVVYEYDVYKSKLSSCWNLKEILNLNALKTTS